MEAIRQWALCITLSAIAGAVIYILSPKGATEKAVKTVVSLFIITAILSPFISGKGIKLNLKLSQTPSYSVNANQLQEKINEQLKSRAEEEIEKKIETILKKSGIEGGQIAISTDIDKEGSISIKETRLIIPKKYSAYLAKIKGEIKDTTGLDAEIEIR